MTVLNQEIKDLVTLVSEDIRVGKIKHTRVGKIKQQRFQKGRHRHRTIT